MQVETLGHATLLLEKDGLPLLATDPWLTGSTYWRSWWIENYPGSQDIERLRHSPWLYITHEHPDHYHPPSLRLLREGLAAGEGPEVLLPDFLKMGMEAHLRQLGYRTRRLPAYTWTPLTAGVQVLSIPLWNNDSILLIDTPEALLVNLNDAKPGSRVLRQLGRLRAAMGKRCVLLRSYSPASPMNSYLRDGKRLERSGKRDFVRAAATASRLVGADHFLPFASQVVFRRPDTDWANDFKVRYADLRRHWKSPARLHPPYSRLDLASGAIETQPPETFDARVNARTVALVAEQEEANRRAELRQRDVDRLEDQFRELRGLLRLLLPRGFVIRADGRRLAWNSRRGRLERRAQPAPHSHFTLELPLLPLQQASEFGHLGDISIPMFTTIHLDAVTPPRRVDAFFMLLILRDYGYLGSLRRLLRWLRWAGWLAWRQRRPLALPSAEVVRSADARRAGGLGYAP